MKSKGSSGRKARISLVSALLLSVSSMMLGQQEKVGDQEKVRELMTQAYAMLPTNNTGAILLLEEAAGIDPSNVIIHRQLGSSYIMASRLDDALRQFSVANTLAPSDTTQLQLAYLLNTLGRNKEALDMFAALTRSSDPDIGEKARNGQTVLRLAPCPTSNRLWAQLSLSPYYDSRFENSILTGAFRAGIFPGNQRIVSLYGIAAVIKDTRSSSGAVPVIFSDNYALVGGGVRVQPFKGFNADIQGGVAVDLVDRPGMSASQGDFRAIASYGVGMYPELATPNFLHFTFKPFVDLHMSGGYYSRYVNTISYAQLRGGFRAVEWQNTAFDLYLRADFASDTKREYYNNIAEASIGVRLIPSYLWNLSVLTEYHRGTYWDSGLSTGPYNRYYDSFRLLLVFDQPICLR